MIRLTTNHLVFVYFSLQLLLFAGCESGSNSIEPAPEPAPLDPRIANIAIVFSTTDTTGTLLLDSTKVYSGYAYPWYPGSNIIPTVPDGLPECQYWVDGIGPLQQMNENIDCETEYGFTGAQHVEYSPPATIQFRARLHSVDERYPEYYPEFTLDMHADETTITAPPARNEAVPQIVHPGDTLRFQLNRVLDDSSGSYKLVDIDTTYIRVIDGVERPWHGGPSRFVPEDDQFEIVLQDEIVEDVSFYRVTLIYTTLWKSERVEVVEGKDAFIGLLEKRKVVRYYPYRTHSAR